MPHTLPTAGALIKDSWQLFTKTWNETTRITMWFLYLALAEFLLTLLAKYVPGTDIIQTVGEVAVLVLYIWTSLRITILALGLADGNAPAPAESGKQAWTLFWPLLGIAFLQVLVLAGAALPLIAWVIVTGYVWVSAPAALVLAVAVVLALPVFYLAVSLTFSTFLRIDGKQKGFAVLSQSFSLVRERWAGVFWRLLAGGFIYSVGSYLLTFALVALVSVFVGPARFFGAIADPFNPDPLVSGVLGLLQGIVMASTIAFILIYEAKLLRAVERK